MGKFAGRGVMVVALTALGAMAALVPVHAVTAGVREPVSPDPALRAAREARVTLPLPDLAAQVVMTSVPGITLSHLSSAQLRALRPGGVIVFGDNYASRIQLARWIRSVTLAGLDGDVTRPRPLLSIDQEGGVVKRITDAPPTRSHPQLGATGRPALTRAQGRMTAALLARLGIQLDLAPVADLDLGPRHLMRERSFGADPARVGSQVASFIAGLRSGGGASSVKHFPGFGGASVNSDDALARITRTRTQLEADLTPFRSAIAADADSIMVSHGIYTAIDRRHPASTSTAMYRLLREELGYQGIAITDSLNAAGFAAATRDTAVAGCVPALAAGADIVLLTGTLAEAAACRARIIAAVRTGALPRARLNEAAERVLTLKARLGLLTTDLD